MCRRAFGPYECPRDFCLLSSVFFDGTMNLGMNIKQKIAVVLINVLVLAELALSIYLGSKDQDMVLTFLKIYIPALLITLFLGRIFIRKLGSEESAGKDLGG